MGEQRETGERSNSHSNEIKTIVAKSATMLNRDISTEELDEWAKTLDRYSIEEVRWAFQLHRRSSQWWPAEKQIIDLIVSLRQAAVRRDDRPVCEKCKGTSWVPKHPHQIGTVPIVIRCQCWVARVGHV